MNKAYIKAIDFYLPDKIVHNEDLIQEFPEWTVEKIASKVGVSQRHIAAENETATDLAIRAAEKLFKNNPEISRSDIDFVILCTQSPDYFLPTSACIIQDRLKLPTSCGAFDFNLGCSGYIYGLAIAKGLIYAGIAKNILLLTAETYSKYLHNKDKGNRTIFGDAATATIVSSMGLLEIGDFSLGTDGTGAGKLIVETGAARHKNNSEDVTFDENGNPHSKDFLFMDGAEIFSFTQEKVPEVIVNTLFKNNVSKDQIDMFVLHQANSYMLEFLRKKIKIDKNKYYVNMSGVGNTVSNSIPIALADLIAAKKARGSILICGFGVGYSWGGCILKNK